ncbi:hypothetical protein D3C74_240720 [compost metagenome]
MITKIVKDFGFVLNREKLIKGRNRISLNGFVIDTEIRVSRKKKQDLAKILFLYEYQGVPQSKQQFIDRLKNETFYYRKVPFVNIHQVINYLAGYRSFLIDWYRDSLSINSGNKNTLLIKRMEELIVSLEKLN